MRLLVALGFLVASSRGWTLADVNTTEATRFQSVPYVLQMSVDVGDSVRAYTPSASQAAQLWQQDTSNVAVTGGLRLRNIESGLCVESYSVAPMLRMSACQTNYAAQEFTTATTSCTGTPTGYSCTDVVRFKSEFGPTNTLFLSIASDGIASLQADDASNTNQWMNLLTGNPCQETDCFRCSSGGLNPLADICGWCETRETCELGDSSNGYVSCPAWKYINSECLLPQDGSYQTRFCTGTGGTVSSGNMMTALTNANSAVANCLDNYLQLGCQTAVYTEWYGAYTSTRYNIVLSGFTRLREEINDGGFVLVCDTQTPTCLDSNYAYVYPSDPGHNIHICTIGMQAPVGLEIDSLPGTIIHEFTHFSDIRGTSDFAYGTTNVRTLAQTTPDESVMNADSYEYFAESSPTCTTCTTTPTPNTRATAYTLDLSNGFVSLTGLRLCAALQEIWYQFTVPSGVPIIRVVLNFIHANADVDGSLFFGTTSVASGVGLTDQESFSHSNPSPGTYFLQIITASPTTLVSISGSVSFSNSPVPSPSPSPSASRSPSPPGPPPRGPPRPPPGGPNTAGSLHLF